MKRIFFTFYFFLPLIILSQTREIKQITNFDFDSRNPAFFRYEFNDPWFLSGEPVELMFEAHSDSGVNIGIMEYDSQTDQFGLPNFITSNSFMNINPKGLAGYGTDKMMIWETNENGNWDIAYSTNDGSGWSNRQFLTTESENERNASFAALPYYNLVNYIPITFQRDSSIVLLKMSQTSTTEEIVFAQSDSFKYSQPAGMITFFGGGDMTYIVCISHKNGENPKLVYRTKVWNDTSWSSTNVLFDEGISHSPKFIDMYFSEYTSLTFESKGADGNQVYYFNDIYDIEQGISHRLIEESSTRSYNLTAFTVPATTSRNEYEYYDPYTYKIIRNDSAFVRYSTDTLLYNDWYEIYTKLADSKINIGPLGLYNLLAVSYAIWEDSSNGRVNLFGFRRFDIVMSNVEENFTIDNCALYQNYPNPFNPSTRIKYSIPSFVNSQTSKVKLRLINVKLIVYDVLGREVAVLVNDIKSSGIYEIEFDATGLAGGIYFYSLTIYSPGNKSIEFRETKKLLYLK